MKNPRPTHIKIYPQDKDILFNIKKQVEMIEKKRVIPTEEFISRIIKSENVKRMTINDALKRSVNRNG